MCLRKRMVGMRLAQVSKSALLRGFIMNKVILLFITLVSQTNLAFGQGGCRSGSNPYFQVLHHRGFAEIDLGTLQRMISDAGAKIYFTKEAKREDAPLSNIIVETAGLEAVRRILDGRKGILIEESAVPCVFSTRELMLTLDMRPAIKLGVAEFFELLKKNQLSLLGQSYQDEFIVLRQGLEVNPTDEEFCVKLKKLPGISDCSPSSLTLGRTR